MAQSYEMFLRTIRTSSPREQEELWKTFLQRSYTHERATLLKQVLRFMDREDPEALRTTFREYKAEREAQRQAYGNSPSGSDPVRRSSSPSDSERPAHRETARRPGANPQWEPR